MFQHPSYSLSKILCCTSLCFVFLLACKSKPKVNETILAIKELQELATVEMTVSKIIKANDDKTWYKLGDRKILMSCKATVKAGINLKLLDAESIVYDNEKITLYLPAPEIISFNMPAENIELAYEEVGALRQNYSSAERDALQQQGETQIRASLASTGILEQAKLNTELYMTNLLQRLGYTNISISFGAKPTTTKG
jgi:hypothetical protein